MFHSKKQSYLIVIIGVLIMLSISFFLVCIIHLYQVKTLAINNVIQCAKNLPMVDAAQAEINGAIQIINVYRLHFVLNYSLIAIGIIVISIAVLMFFLGWNLSRVKEEKVLMNYLHLHAEIKQVQSDTNKETGLKKEVVSLN